MVRLLALVPALLVLAAPVAAQELPVPPAALTFAHDVMKPAQGGQRVRVTIPVSAGTGANGISVAYRWKVRAPGHSPRCRPGALPAPGAVQAGTAIDVALPAPAHGWCRGDYDVELVADVVQPCGAATTDCPLGDRLRQTVAREWFRVGAEIRPTCRQRGETELCRWPDTYANRGYWSVTAPIDDLIGPDGGTIEAYDIFWDAFDKDPRLKHAEWEVDDQFYGYPKTRAQAEYMARAVSRILRAGKYYKKR